MKKIINFLKYHNAMPIAVGIVLLATGGAMAASDDARGFVYNTENTSRSVDNSYLLNMEIERSDFGLVILEIEEDDQGYYIKYQYNTVKVAEYSWQPVSVEGSLTITKSALGGQDLGELIARELGQLIDREYVYAKDAQKIERAKGPSQKVVTTKYAGLIGALLDPKDKIFPGYEPVVKPAEDVSGTTTSQGGDVVSESGSSGAGQTTPSVIYPQSSADYGGSLKNVVPQGENEAVPGWIEEEDPTADYPMDTPGDD